MSRLPGQPKVKKNLYINKRLSDRIDELLIDAATGRVPHGAWSSLVESLLNRHYRTAQLASTTALVHTLKTQGTENVIQP